MERIVIIGNDRFSAELARACLVRGLQTVSVVTSDESRMELAWLGHDVRQVPSLGSLDETMGEAVVSPFMEERIAQTNWLWLSEVASEEPNELAIGRLLDWTDAPGAADLATWATPVLFADFEAQIELLAEFFCATHFEECKVRRSLSTHSASEQDVAATLGWLQGGNPMAELRGVAQGPWKDWWRLHGFGLRGNRVEEDGMPQTVWRVPGVRLTQSVVFAPGYKGFSLWGAWARWAQLWAARGWQFEGVDFSGNGTTSLWPRAIQDEARWSRNTYFAEAQELAEWICALPPDRPLVLMGHSRGAVSTLFAARQAEARGRRLKAVVLLAPVAHPRERFPVGEALESWRRSNRLEVRNARTGQILVHPFRFYEDYLEHEDALDPIRNARALECPVLAFHAADDSAVLPSEGRDLAAASSRGQFHLLSSGGHTFGTKEPWDSDDVSEELRTITEIVLQVLK